MADDDTDMFELLSNALICGNDVVEGFRDTADETAVMGRQADGEIAAAHGLQGIEKLRQIERTAVELGAVGGDRFRGWNQIGIGVRMLEQSRFAGGHGAPKDGRVEETARKGANGARNCPGPSRDAS